MRFASGAALIRILHVVVGTCALLSARAIMAVDQAGSYGTRDASLKVAVIDTDEKESFLSMGLDGAGRLFVGCREALFVYEPRAGGLYQPRKLLYRFPRDTWIYDVAVRGEDLYVLTTGALYVIPGGDVRRTELSPRRLLWGMPVAHVHQGLHGMAFGPDGDLYISQGDQLWFYGDFKRMPDHWGHWTLFHGEENAATPYTGAGGVLRLSADGKRLAVIANGTRNDCGLAFDEGWNLFGNDNDHESMPREYVPGRLLHLTPHAYFNWPRGWMREKQPWRSDLLETMTPDLGRYVPVGMVYYGDGFLPAAYRGSLFVPEWGSRKIGQYPLRAEGDTFKTAERMFLSGDGEARPVGVAVGRGGRMFATICYMAHNDASPIYRSDLMMITRGDDAGDAPFVALDHAGATTEKLFAELEERDWSRRYLAHVELTRRGAEAAKIAAERLDRVELGKPAAAHWIWLAAAEGDGAARNKIIALTKHADAGIRCQAVRALARFGAGDGGGEVFVAALRDPSAPVRVAALVGLFDQTDGLPFEAVAEAARDEGTYVRQTAAFLLARRATAKQLAGLCESADVKRRRSGILAAGFRLTVPEWDKAPEAATPLADGNSGAYRVTYAGGVREDLSKPGRTGNFRIADWWAKHAASAEEKLMLSLLSRRLADPDSDLARQAALFLRLLGDQASAARVDELLGVPAAEADAKPIANAKATGAMEVPEAFRGIDWMKEPKGNAAAGQKLFVERGCVNCHSIKEGDAGGGGPSLAGAGSRFNVPYLVESVLVPNKVVAPQFRWTRAKLKGGDEVTGLVTGETAGEIEFLLPTGIRQRVARSEIVASEIQDRSPMPEGLVQTPAEMRDVLAFLVSLK